MFYSVSHGIPQHSSAAHSVQFENLEKEYGTNEDIKIKYGWQKQGLASPRNWIGLFPKDASNLQNYIAFEWTFSDRNNHGNPKSNTVIFPAKFHKNFVDINKEYYFIFVDTQMKIVGVSSYFHFTPSKTNDVRRFEANGLQRRVGYNSGEVKSLDSKEDQHEEELFSFQYLSQEHVRDKTVQKPTPKQKERACSTPRLPSHLSTGTSSKDSASDTSPAQLPSTQGVEANMSQSMTNLQFSHIGNNRSCRSADVTLMSPDIPLPPNLRGISYSAPPAFKYTPLSDFSSVENKLQSKIKLGAEYSRTLEKRIRELENEVEMSVVSLKKLRITAQHCKREKASYQRFIKELFSVLSTKGSLRVMDGRGTELLLKKVVNLSEDDEHLLLYKMSHRERLFRMIITWQENAIESLMSQLTRCSSPRTAATLKENSGPLLGGEAERLQKFLEESGSSLFTTTPKQSQNKSKLEETIDKLLEDSYPEPTVSLLLPADLDAMSCDSTMDAKEEEDRSVQEASRITQPHSFERSTPSAQDLKTSMVEELHKVFQKKKGGKQPSINGTTYSVSKGEDSDKSDKESSTLVIQGDRMQYALIQLKEDLEKTDKTF